jgi:putative transposase
MFKGHCFPKAIILQAVYFKLRFSLSYRDLEELLSIRGVKVDHATIQHWVFKFTPLVEQQFRKRKKLVGKRWRLDATISGIEVVRMIKKNQLVNPESSTYKSFISLAS